MEAIVEAAGFPGDASSRLPAEQYLVPGVQDHDDVGGVDQTAGKYLQLPVGVLLELQGARKSRGSKLDFQHSAHLAIHSLEGEAGFSACSPDPVEGGQ